MTSGAPPASGDERCGIGLPAIGNLHSHTFQRAMSGLAERRGVSADTFWTWRETMYAHALAMTPDDVEAIAAQAYVEMLEAGYGAVAEFHYLHHAENGAPYADLAEMALRIARAAAETGIGLTLLPVFYAHSDFGGAAARPEQRRFVNDPERYARLVGRCREALGETAVVGLRRTRFARRRRKNSPRSSRSPTGRPFISTSPSSKPKLMRASHGRARGRCAGCLITRTSTNAGASSMRRMLTRRKHLRSRASGAVAGLCPITEANLGDGVFPARAFLDAGGRFGVGTDSNVRIGLANELRMLEYAQRLSARARNVLAPAGGSTGRALFDAAAAGGAQALGRVSGRLAVGASADIVSLAAASPLLAGRDGDAILDTWIFGGARDLVDAVWSGGRKVVSEGRHILREPIAARFANVLRRLADRGL